LDIGKRFCFFLADCCSQIPVRGDDGARAVGAIDDDDDDVGFGERRRWWRRRVAQRGSATYRVIDSDRQILQHWR
jgi:hypothetical protein